MPGGRLRSFRLGDRSELLIELLLTGLAFTTRVPRQEDIGFDFFCSLISGTGDLLRSGPVFTVQAKSSKEPLVFEKEHEIEWITHLENPFFICVADRPAMAMDVYSTWNVMCGPLARGQQRMSLLPGVGRDDWPGVVHKDDGSQEIRLGAPIVRVTVDDVFDNKRIEGLTAIINEWVALDRTNIVNRHAGTYWVEGPLNYKTGQPPYAEGQRGIAFYWHPENLAGCARNLGRAATAIHLINRDYFRDAEREAAIRDVLRSNWGLLDESVRVFLRAQGLNFDL